MIGIGFKSGAVGADSCKSTFYLFFFITARQTVKTIGKNAKIKTFIV